MRWKPFAFNHVRLDVPEHWSLMKFHGDARRGDLVLEDGERAVLDAEWGPCPAKDTEALERKLVHRRKGIRVRERLALGDRKVAFDADWGGRRMALMLVLEPSLERFLFLRWLRPRKNPEPFARRIVAHLGVASADAPQPWRFFASAFDLPPGFLLAEGEIRVGCAKLTFVRRGRLLTLWDFALLDRLEKRQALDAFAVDLAAREYRKRVSIFREEIERGRDPAAFVAPGRIRRRWLVDPRHLLRGNRRVRLQGVPDRARNRYAVILYRFRRDEDLDWIGGLAESLAGEPSCSQA